MAVVFHGISGDPWCPYAILVTNNTTLVEFAKPPEFQTVCNRQRAGADRAQKLLKLRGYFALMLLKH